jgi:hypothetical protein
MIPFLDFRWRRYVDGYTLVRMDLDEHLEKSHTNRDSKTDEYDHFVGLKADAPDWLRDYVSNDKASFCGYGRNGEFYINLDWNKSWGVPDDLSLAFLVPNSDVIEDYSPLESFPGLFMELAYLPNTTAAAVDFTSRFGRYNRHPNEGSNVIGPFELGYLVVASRVRRELAERWKNSHLSGERIKLLDGINQNIEDLADIQLRLQWDQNRDCASFSVVPDDLEAALWLQFAQAIAGNIPFRKCDACQVWFEVAPGRGRPEKTYCSNACSMRAYRRRKSAQHHGTLENDR